MIKVALSVIVQAKPGKEKDVADFLRDARSIVEQEQDTRAWFALQLDESTFGIFDVFPDDDARQTHLSGGASARHSPRRVESCSVQNRVSRASTCSHTSCPARATRGISPRRDSTMIPTSRVHPRGCGYPWPSASGVNLREAGRT